MTGTIALQGGGAFAANDELDARLLAATGADRVVGNEGIRQLARNVPGVALTFIPDANHEILGERDMIRRQFLAALDSFLPA